MRPIDIHVFLHNADTEVLAEIRHKLEQLLKGQKDNMASLQERFDMVNSKLDEASTEILAEIAKLKEGGTLTPEQETALENIETKANALGDIGDPVE